MVPVNLQRMGLFEPDLLLGPLQSGEERAKLRSGIIVSRTHHLPGTE